MKDRLTPSEKVRRVLEAFERGAQPGSLYEALKLIHPLDEAGARALIAGFQCSEWRGALGCARALGHRRAFPELAIPAIAGLLGHEEQLIRQGAVEALGRYGSKAIRVAPAILEALRREEGAFHIRPYVAALTAIGAPASLVFDDYLPLLEECVRKDPMGLGAEIAKALARMGPEARRAAPLLTRALDGDNSRLELEAARALVAILGKDAPPAAATAVEADRLARRPPPPPPPRPATSTPALESRLVLATTFPYPRVSGRGPVLAGRRILEAQPAREWANDDEEFGAIRIDPATLELRAVPLPVRFPARRNGASGAKRSFEPAGPFRGGTLFRMICPFADARGWGNDNFLFWLGPDDAWMQVIVRGGTWDMARLDEDARDKDLPKVCHGELEVRTGKGGVQLVSDTTPYHLDDWEHSEYAIAKLDDEHPAPAGPVILETKESGKDWYVGDELFVGAENFVGRRMGTNRPVWPLHAFKSGDRLFVSARGEVDWLFVWRT